MHVIDSAILLDNAVEWRRKVFGNRFACNCIESPFPAFFTISVHTPPASSRKRENRAIIAASGVFMPTILPRLVTFGQLIIGSSEKGMYWRDLEPFLTDRSWKRPVAVFWRADRPCPPKRLLSNWECPLRRC